VGEATILVDRDGHYIDASPSALALLGVSLEELRSLPPGSISAEQIDEAEREARRAAFVESGVSSAVGATTIQRPDGRRLHVRFFVDAQPDGRFLARLRPTEEEPDQPTKVYTVGQVLAAWRAAERRLESLSPDTAEWAAAQAEIERFRVEYRRLASDGQTRRQ
jgi:PAS domain S-box-containing protein